MTVSDASGRIGSLRPVLGASVLLFLTVLSIASVKSWHDLSAARERRRQLEARIQATEAEIARLNGRIERLHTDPGLLERLAREDLGMVRPGDVVIELPLPVPPPPAPQPAVVQDALARPRPPLIPEPLARP